MAALALYAVAIHLLIVALILKTNFLVLAGKTLGWLPPEEWNQPLVDGILETAARDETALPGAVVLIGDSMMAALDPASIGSDAINFGIGGDTAQTLLRRLPTLRSVTRSRAVILGVGVNDLKYRPIATIGADYAAVLNRLLPAPAVLALSALPVDENGPAAGLRRYLRNRDIAALNAQIRAACRAHANCRYVDAWPALANAGQAVFGEDGWHLSPQGRAILAALIRSNLPGR
jgi:lysophospholipase L1-like esterase